jgi:hypothetical protein
MLSMASNTAIAHNKLNFCSQFMIIFHLKKIANLSKITLIMKLEKKYYSQLLKARSFADDP